MKKIIEYTSDFDNYNSELPFLECKYKILVTHDNSLSSVSEKISFSFINPDNSIVKEQIINEWRILKVEARNYYGRAKIFILVEDPTGIRLPAFESGGFSLVIDEKLNIDKTVSELTINLKEVLRTSFFTNYRRRLDYINLFKKENPERTEIYYKI